MTNVTDLIVVVIVSVVEGVVKVFNGLRRRHRVGRVDGADGFCRIVEVMVVVFDPLTVLSDLDHSPELLLNRLRLVVIGITDLKVVNRSATNRSVPIRPVPVSGT